MENESISSCWGKQWKYGQFQVNGQLQTVDELMNMLMTSLYENNLHNCVNLIILADHGRYFLDA